MKTPLLIHCIGVERNANGYLKALVVTVLSGDAKQTHRIALRGSEFDMDERDTQSTSWWTRYVGPGWPGRSHGLWSWLSPIHGLGTRCGPRWLGTYLRDASG